MILPQPTRQSLCQLHAHTAITPLPLPSLWDVGKIHRWRIGCLSNEGGPVRGRPTRYVIIRLSHPSPHHPICLLPWRYEHGGGYSTHTRRSISFLLRSCNDTNTVALYATHTHAALFLPAAIRTRRRVFYPHPSL